MDKEDKRILKREGENKAKYVWEAKRAVYRRLKGGYKVDYKSLQQRIMKGRNQETKKESEKWTEVKFFMITDLVVKPSFEERGLMFLINVL